MFPRRYFLPMAILLAAAAGFSAGPANPAAELGKALTFHTSFDRGTDADFALGDRRVYTASSYKNRQDSSAGLQSPDVSIGGVRL